jgi:hypothetical protein
MRGTNDRDTTDHRGDTPMTTSTASGIATRTVEPGPAIHDFDFFPGTWRVHHRRLVDRLAGSDEWQEFEGLSRAWPLLDGAGNIDDNVLELPAGTYRAITLRTYEPWNDRWSIWWLDGRAPGRLDPPVVGGFTDGVGTFIGQDTFEGRPILVRLRWSDITEETCHWEQAFSDDDGETWETNWTMEFSRIA